MKAGELRHRVFFYNTVQTPMPSGGTEANEVLYWETNAKITPAKQSRSFDGALTKLTNDWQFVVRYRRDKMLTKNMVIYYLNNKYTVNSVQQYEEDRQMLLITGSLWQ